MFNQVLEKLSGIGGPKFLLFFEVLEKISGFRSPELALNTRPLPIKELDVPSLLSFSLTGPDGRPYSPTVEEGDETGPGQFMADDGSGPVLVSPVKGKVVAIISAPDIRGTKVGSAILVEPAADTSPQSFPGLDPQSESGQNLWARIKEAGILTDSSCPRPLAQKIGPDAGDDVDMLIVLAADREPEVASAFQLFRERSEDACRAAAMLGKMSGAKRVMIAAPESADDDVEKVCKSRGVEVMPVPAYYPYSLEPMVIELAGGAKGTKVVAVETALAALDAVADGVVQDKKVVTLIGPAGQAKANYRVHIGTRLKDLFSAVGLKPRDQDKVVVGGPMRGFAQYSLDGSVDAGVDAFMLMPIEAQIMWSDEPCINCGGCVDVCPVNLQPQLIGRYAEFGLFDRTEELAIENCIECGLCAYVCTGRRPLLQWIRLAKKELEKQKMAARVKETAACAESDQEKNSTVEEDIKVS